MNPALVDNDISVTKTPIKVPPEELTRSPTMKVVQAYPETFMITMKARVKAAVALHSLYLMIAPILFWFSL